MRGYNKESLNRVSRKLGSCEKKKIPQFTAMMIWQVLSGEKRKGKVILVLFRTSGMAVPWQWK